MSIPNYVRPQLTIKQLLDRTPSANIGRINAIVVGPQYLLSRYGAETTPSFTFSAAETVLPFQYIGTDGSDTTLVDEVVDLNSVEVHAEKLEAVLATDLTSDVTVPTLSDPAVIKSAATFAGSGTLDTALAGRDVQIGDVFYLTYGGVTRRRKVAALIGKDSVSSNGTNVDKDDGKAKASTYNATAAAESVGTVVTPVGFTLAVTDEADFNADENYNRGPRLKGKFGDKFTLTVIQGGVATLSKIRISSASGLYSKASLTSTAGDPGEHVFTNAELGNLEVTLAGGNLIAGQVFSFEVYGEWDGLAVDEVALATLKVAGTYTGPKDTTYMIRVSKTNSATTDAAGAELTISDTAGVEATQTVVIGTDNVAEAMGVYGLTVAVKLVGGAIAYLLAGETYYVHAVAAKQSTSQFDRVRLDGPAVDTTVYTNPATALTTVEHRIEFTGEVPAGQAADASAWSADANGVAVQAGLSLQVTARTSNEWVPFADSVGKLFVSFRALVPPAYGESIIPVDTSSDITSQLGTIDLDNDLAYAASQALAGSQGQRIYALRVNSDDAEGFNSAFTKVESTDLTYAFAIISENEAVKQAAKLHVLAMSQPEQKKFRRAYIGTDSPGDYLKVSVDGEGDNILATISDNGGAYTLLSLAETVSGIELTDLGLVAGDKVKIAGGTYAINRVISDTQLELTVGPNSGIAPAQAIEIWKTDTPDSQIDYVAQVSAGLGTRRVANIWVENGRKIVDGLTTDGGTLRHIPCRYIAAEIAGLRSAVLPQQGLTRTEVTAITEASAMHTRYSPAQLDRAAAAGTFVITQDVESGAVFVRHQLTTETDKGSLYYEDSVGVNLDNISFAVKDVLEGYIGKYNVNRQTISEIRNRIFQLLTGYTQADVETSIGPALIRFDNLVVEADAILKDRVNVSARLFMPLPLNNAEVTLQGSVDLTL